MNESPSTTGSTSPLQRLHPGSAPVARLAIVVATAAVLCLASASRGQDLVTLRAEGGGSGSARISGEIEDFTGAGLRLRSVGDRVQIIPADQVEAVETDRSDAHRQADELASVGRRSDALPLYQQARQQETRGWVRRMITAEIVRCAVDADANVRAGEEFALLIHDDPRTPYFSTIPLAWQSSFGQSDVERAAAGWLADDGSPAMQLVGASHLLGSNERPSAVSMLKQLAAGSDRTIALLATCQLWRITPPSGVTEEDLDRRADVVARVPADLRAGPYFVLGRSWMAGGQPERAALAWMRIPILYPDHRRLAAKSLFDAGGAIEQLNRPRQASTLYREILDRYGETPTASLAEERLTAAAAGSSNTGP